MPLGIERINARVKQPNDRINFIKPLEGSNKAKSQDFLERIAAIVNPIMKKHHIAVMSLEEYEPNPEFLGRNFNAGEVVQLVLKTRSGNWMPFKFVQMVMIHELSHCKQMNHSKAFWKVKNDYASELEILWTRGYTGEGMWSRGIKLADGQFANASLEVGEPLPGHLCGGTYQSRGRKKRKVKEKVTYKERQARRIAKKFGTNGQALGADEVAKLKLDKRKKPTAKPRVAGSARGRELRAAAALARFEVKKDEPLSEGRDEEYGSETEGNDEYDMLIKTEPNEAVDINGEKLLDGEGKGMFRVCEDEDRVDIDAQNEMSQLRDIIEHEHQPAAKSTATTNVRQDSRKEELVVMVDKTLATPRDSRPQRFFAPVLLCPICSMENDPGAPTCSACANVLDESKVLGVWICRSEICRYGSYVNAEDCGVCGLCGARKCSLMASDLRGVVTSQKQSSQFSS